MTTDLTRFTQWARESPQRQYTALMGMLYDPEGLNASFERLAANKAPGVDGMRKAEYADGSAERLADLAARLRRLGYRPKPVRRVYIPKTSGKGRRALGVPSSIFELHQVESYRGKEAARRQKMQRDNDKLKAKQARQTAGTE